MFFSLFKKKLIICIKGKKFSKSGSHYEGAYKDGKPNG